MREKHSDRANYNRDMILISVCSVLLVFVLVIIAAFAWFAMSDNDSKTIAFGIGKVSYKITDAENLFYSSFDIDKDDYYEDDFDETEGYRPATSIDKILAGGIEINSVNEIYSYELEKSAKTRITLALNPMNSTDKISFSSSNPSSVSVSQYGTIRAVGNVDDEPTKITITVHDRTPNTTRADIVTYVYVKIIKNTQQDENLFGFLPGNVNLLKNPLVVTNYSTVESKLRLKVEWQYTDYDISDTELNQRKIISVSDLMSMVTGSPNMNNIKFNMSQGVKAPLSLTINDSFKFVSPENDSFSFVDDKACYWTIKNFSLTETEKAEIVKKLSTTDLLADTDKFVISEKMIDNAYIYVVYSNGTESGAILPETDYGTAINKVDNTQMGTSYEAITTITTSDGYAGFSTRKLFSVSIKLQARQAGFYEENEWFDVYCTNVKHSANIV